MHWITARGLRAHGGAGPFLPRLLYSLLLVTTVPLVSGPRPTPQPRNRLDLDRGRVTASTAALREVLLEKFQEWISREDPDTRPLPELARWDPIQVATLLEEYGRVCYEDGTPRRSYAETINIVVQRFPYLKNYLAGPWRLLTTWEGLLPGKVHPPMPAPLLKALVATALVWDWMRFAMILLIGFYALLRPCELIALKVQDCLLSTDTDCADVIFLRLKLVKSRTRGARMQSVRLDVPFVVHFLKKCFAVMQPDEQIWSFSAATLRRRLQQTLQVVAGHSYLCLPSSLRQGGATYWFRVWQEDLPRLQWRGRWLHFKTLAHYIQEVGCVNVMEQVTPAFRLKIQSLAALSEAACKEYVVKADLCSQVQRLLSLLHKQQEIQRPTPM